MGITRSCGIYDWWSNTCMHPYERCSPAYLNYLFSALVWLRARRLLTYIFPLFVFMICSLLFFESSFVYLVPYCLRAVCALRATAFVLKIIEVVFIETRLRLQLIFRKSAQKLPVTNLNFFRVTRLQKP